MTSPEHARLFAHLKLLREEPENFLAIRRELDQIRLSWSWGLWEMSGGEFRDRAIVHLAMGMWPFQEHHGLWQEQRDWATRALAAARALDLAHEARQLQVSIGWCQLALGRPREAIDPLTRALPKRARTEQERRLRAMALYPLSEAYARLGDMDKALKHKRALLRTIRQLGLVPGEVRALRGLGELYLDLGRTDVALRHLRRALLWPKIWATPA